MTKVIEVTVSSQGEVKVETRGFVGAECQQASRLIEQALGQRLCEQLTSEFHLAAAVNKISDHH